MQGSFFSLSLPITHSVAPEAITAAVTPITNSPTGLATEAANTVVAATLAKDPTIDDAAFFGLPSARSFATKAALKIIPAFLPRLFAVFVPTL